MYLPLVIQGYIILTYDARGHGESKRVGKRSQFIERIEDYQKIINWIIKQPEFREKNIYSIGFSIGGLVALSGSFTDLKVKKIIAMSAISDYKKTVRRSNPIVLLSFLLKGIKIFPKEEEINLLSPGRIISKAKRELSNEKWRNLSKRVYLIHTKNDQVIKFHNFKENISILDLPEENQLIFRKGGHTSKKNEIAITGAILSFLNN